MGLFNIRMMGLDMCIFQGKPLELVHDNPPASGLKGHGFSIATFEKTVGLSHFRKGFSAGWWFGTCFFPYIGNNHPKYWLKTPTSQDLNGSFSFPNDFAPVFWTNDDRASRSISKEFGHPKHQAYSDFRTFTQGELGKLVNMAKWRNVPGTWKD